MAHKSAPGRLYLELRPSALLAALHALHRTAAGVEEGVLGATLTRGLEQALRASEEAMAKIGQLLEWLASQKLCRPAQGKGALRLTAPVLVVADLMRVLNKAQKERTRTDPAHVTLAVVRTLLEALERSPWLGVSLLYWNGRKRTLAEARVRMEALVAKLRPPREERVRAKEPPPAKVRAKERVQEKAPPRAKAKRAKPGPVRGFGGLPDDAESVGVDTPTTQRGLSDEAQFFLKEAGLDPWPCTAEQLEQGRRRVLARLHPDRTHGTSTEAFQRAAEGARQLAGVLAAMAPVLAQAPVQPEAPSVKAPAKPEAPSKDVEAKPKAKSKKSARDGSWGQWPPPKTATG